MVNLKPQFRGLLVSTTLARVLVDALPHHERRPLEFEATDISEPNINVWTLLMRRGGGGSASARLRMMRQHEAAALLEVTRSAQAKARLPALNSGGSALGDPEARPTRAEGEVHYHHDPNYHRATFTRPNDPLTILGGANPINAHSHQRHAHPGEAPVSIEQVDRISGGTGAQLAKRHDHNYHHHPPGDTSKAGHSQHWYEHHHPGPDNPHHEHHHARMSGLRPRRIWGHDDDKVDDTFIAPASVRVKSKDRAKSGSRVASGGMTKKPKETAPTGLYRAVRPTGTVTNSSTGTDEQTSPGPEHQLGQGRALVQRSFTANATTSEPTATRLATTTVSTTRMTGIIDLIANNNGARLGGLSVSPMPPSTFGASLCKTSFHDATLFSYLIDATLNPTEQATFYIRRVEVQSFLEPATNPATQAVQNILVSLQAQVPNSEHDPLCATFDPLARDVQTFGLAPCLDDSGTGGSAGASQAFRYSPGTGVVQPFYGADAESGVPVDGEIDQMGDARFNHPNDTLDLNATTAVTLGSNPISVARPDPLLQLGSLFNLATTANSTSSARDPSTLTVPSTLDHTRPFVIGDLEFVSQSLDRSNESGENADERVLMVFRRTHGALDEDQGRSQGVQPEMKRRLGKDDGLTVFEPEPADDGPFDTEPAKNGNPDEPSTHEEPRGRMLVSSLKPRVTGLPTRYAGWEAAQAQVDVTAKESRIMHAGAEHVSTTVHSIQLLPPRPSLSPARYSSPANATGPGTSYHDLDDFGDESNDMPLPKPVVNVAYFGDSGRSPPVPPEDQADNARAILVADPSESKKPGAAPVVLATGSDEGRKNEATIGVYLVGPKAMAKGTAAIVPVAKGDSTHGRDNSAERLPLDASD